MLISLKIENFAIIKEASISFAEGFTVLSGETGAGKSIVIDAISLLLGARSSEEDIRTGENQCSIEGIFSINDDLRKRLGESGIETREDELLIKRIIQRKGKNRIYINGGLSTQGMLYEVGKYLADICAQNENRYLMDPKYHIEVLDQYALEPSLLKRYQKIFNDYSSLYREREDVVSRHKEVKEQADYLKYILSEINNLDLKEGEAQELRGIKKRLQNSQKIKDLAYVSFDSLSSCESSIIDRLKQVEKDLDSLKSIDESFGRTLQYLPDVREKLLEISGELNDYVSSLDFDRNRLEEVEERLDAITRIERKYGSVQEAISKAEDAKRELAGLESFDDDIARMDEKLKIIGGDLLKLASRISSERKKKAAELDEEINRHLKVLSMESARFKTKFSGLEEGAKNQVFNIEGVACSVKGSDEVQFYISTNVGEDQKPLEYVASLGELSRIMLALKGVFYGRSRAVDTFIFDEIDTGIGGKVAEMVGSKLYDLSKGRQVFCVTHLSQIASFADDHLFIEKKVKEGRTYFTVRELSDEQRKEEIARMLGGRHLSAKTRELAGEIVERSRKGLNTR